MIVASPGYIEARGAPESPRDLTAHDCLVYSSVQGEDRWHLEGSSGAASASVALRARLRSNNLSMILSACRAGMGICILPRYVAHHSLMTGKVVQVLPDYAPPAQEVHAVYPSPRLLPRKISNFIGWLRTQLDGEWWARTYE